MSGDPSHRDTRLNADSFASLRRALDQANDRLAALHRKLAAAEAAHAGCGARVRDLEEQNTNLVQLTVASQLLSSTFEHDDVLTTIEEIVINMIGSEEIAIFEVGRDGHTLRLSRVRGIDARGPLMQQATAPILSVLATGNTFVRDAWKTDPGASTFEPTAIIPLKLESSVIGVVAIFRLLQQKATLEPVDHELFDVLSRQAAPALCSGAFRSLRPTVRPPRKSS